MCLVKVEKQKPIVSFVFFDLEKEYSSNGVINIQFIEIDHNTDVNSRGIKICVTKFAL